MPRESSGSRPCSVKWIYFLRSHLYLCGSGPFSGASSEMFIMMRRIVHEGRCPVFQGSPQAVVDRSYYRNVFVAVASTFLEADNRPIINWAGVLCSTIIDMSLMHCMLVIPGYCFASVCRTSSWSTLTRRRIDGCLYYLIDVATLRAKFQKSRKERFVIRGVETDWQWFNNIFSRCYCMDRLPRRERSNSISFINCCTTFKSNKSCNTNQKRAWS